LCRGGRGAGGPGRAVCAPPPHRGLHSIQGLGFRV
jgi:hypothetical protein